LTIEDFLEARDVLSKEESDSFVNPSEAIVAIGFPEFFSNRKYEHPFSYRFRLNAVDSRDEFV
jgi:hypothetical protein